MTAKKTFLVMVAMAAVLAILCSPAWAVGKKNAKIKWKTATLAPDGVGWARQMKSLIFPEIEKVTNGDLYIKIYWGGIMGDEEDVIKKMHIGQLQGAGLSTQGANMICPDMSVTELPFLFNNYDEVDFIKSKMEGTFDKLFAEKGFFLLAWVDQDFDQIFTVNTPVAKVADFKKVKWLTWYGEMEQDLFKVLGTVPIPVGVPEVSSSIRQGVCNGAIGPALWVVGAQMYSVVRYMNPVKIRYSPAVIVITMKTWDALPGDYQEKYHALRGDLMYKYCVEVRKDNVKSIDAMIQYGVKKVEMTPQNLADLKNVTHKVWDNMTGKLYSKELLQELEGYLQEYRSTHK